MKKGMCIQMKITFIEPKAPNLHIFSKFPLPRLGTILLGTIAKQNGWEASVMVEEQAEIDWNEIAASDIVGISTITSTAPRAYAIADRVRSMGITVVMGGPHVTFLPDEALGHCDFVIRGEGETAFPLFLKAVEDEDDLEEVPNLSYKINGDIRHNMNQAVPVDLDFLPYPDFSLIKGKPKCIAGWRLIPFQTSRGCPFDCSFCSVTGMFGRRYRYRSIEHIINELRLYDDRKHDIFFYDDNFGANSKRAAELLKAMEAEKFKFRWSTQVRVDFAGDEDLVRLMRRAGCHTVYIGFESVNEESLKSVKKQQSLAEMERAARIFQKHRIHVHGMFILGLENDSFASVKDTVRFAKRYCLNSSQFLILTPLPGTRCYEDLLSEGRIRFSDWSLYDAHHVVFQPKNFSLEELQRAQMWAHRRFYSPLQSLRRLLRFRFMDISIAWYARSLNAHWNRKNKLYLKLLNLLKPRKGTKIVADFRQNVMLDTKNSSLHHS